MPTLDMFRQQLRSEFRIAVGANESVGLALERVEERGAGDSRIGFSLFFRGPHAYPLSQGTIPMTHGGLGELALFLVPVARRDDGFVYEAVFNQFEESACA